MKIFKKLIFLTTVLIFMSSCAKHITVAYSELPENKNSFIIKPSAPLTNTSVVANGKLLVDTKPMKDVKITGLPDGNNSFQITSGSMSYSENVDEKIEIKLSNGEERTELIKAPTPSKGFWTYMTISYIGGIVLVILLL